MTEDIQKAVEAGKITNTAGGALEKLPPGTFVLHKSWGYGQIAGHDFLLCQTTIDFKSKKGHSMQFQYAAESLVILEPTHIAARKLMDMETLKQMAQKDHGALVRIVLESLGGRATQDQITQNLVPDLFTEATFKKWWENAKKALKADPLVGVPAKKTDPFILREEALSHKDESLSAFKAARTLKDQISALDTITKNLADFKDPAPMQAIVDALEETARKNAKLKTAETLSILVSRDEIAAKVPGVTKGEQALTIARMVIEEEKQLSLLLADLPVSKLKRIAQALPGAFEDRWVAKAVELFLRGNSKVAPELARLLVEHNQTKALATAIDKAIREHSLSSEALHWLCSERVGDFAEIAQSPRTVGAILSAMERDQFKEKRDRKLHDLLMNDQELITDMINSADEEELREVMQKLLKTPVLEELDKRSLLGRIVRVYPEMESLITGGDEVKQEALIVSWDSLSRRKDEYDDLVTKKIPQNIKDIQIAKEYGDLRENFEYKSAKDQQRVLQRRKTDFQRDLARARGTDFANVGSETVAIGTIVSIKRMSDGGEETYSLLGAWDTDPDKHVISYLSQMAQSLIGKKVGDRVSAPTENGEHEVEILKITSYKPA